MDAMAVRPKSNRQGRKNGEHWAAFWYDIVTHHRTPKVLKWLADHKCDRFEIDAAFTWKYQMVDVSLAVPYTFCAKTILWLRPNTKTNYIRSGVIGCLDRLSLINFAKNR